MSKLLSNTLSSSVAAFILFVAGGTEAVADLWISPGDFSSETAPGAPSVTITNIGGTYTGFSLGTSGGNPAPYDEVRLGTILKGAWLTLPPMAPRGTIVLVRQPTHKAVP